MPPSSGMWPQSTASNQETTLDTPNEEEKAVLGEKKYKDWAVEQWRKVIFFSDETHFEVQGYRSNFIRCSSEEPLRSGHIQQAPKHPLKVMFWGCFTDFGPETLHPIEEMMYSKSTSKYLELD